MANNNLSKGFWKRPTIKSTVIKDTLGATLNDKGWVRKRDPCLIIQSLKDAALRCKSAIIKDRIGAILKARG